MEAKRCVKCGAELPYVFTGLAESLCRRYLSISSSSSYPLRVDVLSHRVTESDALGLRLLAKKLLTKAFAFEVLAAVLK